MVLDRDEIKRNEDYNFVEIGKKEIKIDYILFAFGIILLIALFIYGNVTDDVDTQAVLIWVSLFAIIVSIAWTIRKKLLAVAIAFMCLLSIYYVCGLAFQYLTDDVHYSYGIVTFIVISAFVFWVSMDNEITMGDIGKVALFAMMMYIINVTGWLGGVNDITASYFTGGLPYLMTYLGV